MLSLPLWALDNARIQCYYGNHVVINTATPERGIFTVVIGPYERALTLDPQSRTDQIGEGALIIAGRLRA
jgi:hypothetical protein